MGLCSQRAPQRTATPMEYVMCVRYETSVRSHKAQLDRFERICVGFPPESFSLFKQLASQKRIQAMPHSNCMFEYVVHLRTILRSTQTAHLNLSSRSYQGPSIPTCCCYHFQASVRQHVTLVQCLQHMFRCACLMHGLLVVCLNIWWFYLICTNMHLRFCRNGGGMVVRVFQCISGSQVD